MELGQADLEAAFQVPMPGDSGLLSFNMSETVLWTTAKILLLYNVNRP